MRIEYTKRALRLHKHVPGEVKDRIRAFAEQVKRCTSADERIRLRAEIDVIVARDIFHLTREEYEHVLNSVRAGKDRPSPLRTYMEALKGEIRRRWDSGV